MATHAPAGPAQERTGPHPHRPRRHHEPARQSDRHLRQSARRLDQIADIYTKAESAERRMLNWALSSRIVVDEDEQVNDIPDEPVAGVLAHVDGLAAKTCGRERV